MKTLPRLLIRSCRLGGKVLIALAQWFIRCAWAGVIALIMAAAGLIWLDSEPGHQWLSKQLSAIEGIKLAGIDGSLLRNPVLVGLSYQDSDVRLDADRINLDWQILPLLHGALMIDQLQAGRLSITIKPTPPDRPPSKPPTRITLPFALHIQSALINELAISNPDFSLQKIQFRLDSDGRQHRITQLNATQSTRTLSAGLTLDGHAPFPLKGQFEFKDNSTADATAASGQLSGTLRQLVLGIRGNHSAAQIKADLLLDSFAPHAYQILQSGTLAVSGFDPSRWSASWPHAQLDLTLSQRQASPSESRSHLTLRNHQPGPLNTQRIPIETLDSDLLLRGKRLQFDAIQARLPGEGNLRGAGKLEAGRIQLDLKLASMDLAQLWQGQKPTRLAGSVQLSGPWQAPDIKASLTDNQYAARLIADLGWINPKTERHLAIRQLELQHGNSHLAAHGDFDLQSPYRFLLNGNFTALNPAEFASVPAGSLNGALHANGQLSPAPEVMLDYTLNNSSFNGVPLAGAGKVQLDTHHLSNSQLWLSLGNNRITLSGSYGQAGDSLQANITLPALQELGAPLSGQANGAFTLSGTPAQPVLEGNATFNQLLLPSGLSVQQGKLAITLPRDSHAPLKFALEASHIQQGPLLLAQLQLGITGSQNQHAIHLLSSGEIANKPIALNADLKGALLPDWHWLGTLSQLSAQTPAQLRLLEPVTLKLAPDNLQTEGGIFTLEHGRIRLGENTWQPGKISSNGHLENLALADILHWSGRNDFDSDLTFDGHWNLQYADTLNGDMALQRRDGNSIWRLSGIQESLALSAAELSLTAKHNRIDMTAAVRSSRYGSIEFSGNTVVDPPNLALAPGQGLSLRSKGELPDLSALNGLISPDLQLGGNIRFDLQRSGPLDSPHLSGSVNGNSLLIQDSATGLHLREGLMRFTLTDDRMILEEAFFRGGAGNVRAEGVMSYRGGETEANANIVANKLTLFSRSDLLLVLSGKGEVSLKQGVIGISGQIKADQGEIQYRDIDTPRLASDVVIQGLQAAPVLRPPRLTLQVDIDLGDDFRFRGLGVDAQLAGMLRLRAQTARPLTANGKVEIVSGKYRAYGQRLTIERGILSFQGPIDNPGLDILAMRRNLEVESGVLVTGTALAPRVQLYSEPAVPDTEKLAWLLFGHGSDGMQDSDAAIMLKVAQSLLGSNSNGKGVAEDALAKVGIDELGMRSVRETDGTPTRIVTVSSQLGRYFQLSLEKSLNDLRDAVSLTLQVGRNWSLVLRLTNDATTLGANYTLYFD